MKAYVIHQFSQDPSKAFKLIEQEEFTTLEEHQVLIKSEVFGLNFADVVARVGQYQDCPPLPAVIGYDLVGRVIKIGSQVTRFKGGERVVAITRFGGYAEQALADERSVFQIDEKVDAAEACALATQYSTAHYASHYATRLLKGERVLIHAAAGGVGTALIQSALHLGCEVYGVASSEEKRAAVRVLGAHRALSYQEYSKVLREDKVDVVFDSVGGEQFRKSRALLRAGGRLVAYGASSLSDSNYAIQRIWRGLQFGIYHPAQWIIPSHSLIGVNLLALGDQRSDLLHQVMKEVQELHQQGVYRPVIGKPFKASELVQAHEHLQSRSSVGKLVCRW
jgi:NADPH2:quinone reductase